MTPTDLSPAEWRIMNAVWDRHGDTSVRDVHDALHEETEWAYTTVKTMMDRLVDKGALRVERSGKTASYRASLTRGKARREAAKALLARAFDGAVGPLVHELLKNENLIKKERDELERMIERIEKRKSSE